MAKIYVDQNYSGTISGALGSASNPHTTISAAVAVANPGDTVSVAAGDYAENVVIDRPLTLEGAGRATTTLTGNQAGDELGAIVVAPGVNNVTIQGFKVVGIDGTPGLEKAAIYLQGNHANIDILDNEIVANGDAAISSEYSAVVSDVVIDGNIISGATFDNETPIQAFTTFSADQFSTPNVPRVAVYFGNTPTKSGIVFTDNDVRVASGGVDSNGNFRGNASVVLDGTGNTASGNDFHGLNNVSGAEDIDNAAALRMRGTGHVAADNTYDTSVTGGIDGSSEAGVIATFEASPSGDETYFANPGNDTIDGGDGVDTLDMTGAGTGGAVVDLANGGAMSNATGMDSISNIENVKGSAGDDTLKGTDGANTFIATAGHDSVDGRGGSDTFDASGATTAMVVDLAGGSVSGAHSATLTSIENVKTGSGNDTIAGTSGDNAIDGGAGVDTVSIEAGYARATISYSDSDGSFAITSAAGTDTLTNVEKVNFNDKEVWLVDSSAALTYALANAGEGAVIKLAPGDYTGNFTIATDGITLESTTGNPADVTLKGTFKSDNGILGETVGDWLSDPDLAGYNGNAGSGISVSGDNVTIRGITVAEYRNGIDLQSNNGLTIENVNLTENIHGIHKENGSAEVTGFELIGGTISGGYQGIVIAANAQAGHRTEGSFSGVTITGTVFNDLSHKGIYVEQLSNAVIDGISMTDVGQFGGARPFGALGLHGTGIDINLKFQDYSGIEIKNFDFTDVGLSNGLGTPHSNGSAISVKARDDGSTYGSPAAHLDGVNIHDGTIDGNSTGIRVGEPGKATSGPTGVTITDVDNGSSATNAWSYDNQTTTPLNVTLSDGDDVATTNPSATGSVNYEGRGGNDTITGGSQADTIDGGAGNDTINGGGGIDTAVYAVNVNGQTQVSYDAGTNSWTVTTSEGVDTLKDVEIIDDGAGGRVLLVGGDGFDSIQAAVNAAQDGDTIMIAGNWVGDVNVGNKQLTFLGVDADGDGETSDDSSIVGRVDVSGSKDVTFDGLEFRVTGSGHALSLHGSGNYTVRGSVFYNATAGGGTGARAITLDTTVSGHIVIEDNVFTGASSGKYGTASWATGLWSDGTSTDLDVTGNVFNHVRSALNLDGYSDGHVNVSGNTVQGAGTFVSVGTPNGSSFGGIHGNDLSGADSDFNFRNVTTPVTIDVKASGNSSTTPIEILGGRAGDNITGSDGVDHIFADGYKPNEGGYGTNPAGNDVINALGGDDVVFGSRGDDTIDGGAGSDTIDGGGGEDSVAGYDDSYSLKIDANGHWIVTNGTDTDTLTNVERVTIDGKVYLLVDSRSDGGFGSVQDAIDAATGDETILIAPGDYTEQMQYQGGSQIGLVIDKSVTLQGVKADGTWIGDADDVEANIISAVQSWWGTNFFVTADNVAIRGLNFIAADGTLYGQGGEVNKAFEIVGDGFKLQFSKVGAADGVELASTIYINDQAASGDPDFVSAILSYLIDQNILEGSVVVTNGPGIGHDAGDLSFVISRNQFVKNPGSDDSYNWGILVSGKETGISWRLASVVLPEISGNSFTDDYSVVFRALDDDPAKMPTREYIDQFLANNALETYAFAAEANGDPKFGDAANRFFIHRALNDAIADADAGDMIVLKTAAGASSTTINANDLTFDLVAGSGALDLTLGASVTRLGLAGSQDVDVIGNGLDNVIDGNDGDNFITGGAGADTISAGGGNDTVNGGAGSDTLYGGAGDDVLLGLGDNDTIDGGAGSDTIDGGAGGGDTAVYGADFADLTIVKAGNTYIVSDGVDTDVVSNVENITIGGHTVSIASAITNAGPSIASIGATLAVAENSADGTVVATITASDLNLTAGLGEDLTFSLVTASGAPYTGPFTIVKTSATTAEIRVDGALDFEGTNSLPFQVKVTDVHGNEDTQAVTVGVTDVNDNSPVFSSGATATVAENAPVSTVVYDAAAADADTIGGPIVYSLTGNDATNFTINTATGEVRLVASANFEVKSSYAINVVATQGTTSTTQAVTVNVTDVNDNNPVFTSGATATVAENTSASTPVYTAAATDADMAGGAISYSLTGADAAAFTIDATTGQVRLKASANFEVKSIYAINVVAAQGTTSTTQAVTINVTDVNEPVGGGASVPTQSVLMERGSTEKALGLTAVLNPEPETLTYKLTSLPATGTVYLNGSAVAVNRVLSQAEFLALTYSSPDDGTTTASMQFIVSDGTPANDVPLTVNISVTAAVNGTHTGTGGADRLDGAAGNDTIDGGGGADIMIGGSGNDTIVVDNARDVVIELAGGGTDTVQSSINYALGTHVENLSLIGGGNTWGTGNALANILRGNSGNNVLNGGAGADQMYGGFGNDVFYVDNAGDVVIELAGGGTDRVQSSINYTLGTHVENLSLIGGGNTWGTGNALANFLGGNSGNNVLNGGAGADQMHGGLGNDIFYVDNAGDKVFEAANQGSDTVYAAVSYGLAAGQHIEVLATTLPAGTGAINLAGNELAQRINGNYGANKINGGGGGDTLFGYDGNDRLDGGTGADQMHGGLGNDTFIVDNAGDKVFEAANQGSDTVYAAISYALAAGQHIETLATTLQAGTGAINLTGNELAQRINGNNGANSIDGGGGNDTLFGHNGNDTLVGGLGQDTMAGGAGNDTFKFNAIGQSGTTAATRDVITDFVVGRDKIDLGAIDANTILGGNQAFSFIGTAAFTAAGQLKVAVVGSTTMVSADVNGDKVVDFAVALTGVHTLTAGDFIL